MRGITFTSNPLDPLGPIQSEPPPFWVERAEHVYLITRTGKRILDLTSGLLAQPLGHRHPALEHASIRQIQMHTHVMVYGVLPQLIQKRCAQRIKKIIGKTFGAMYFTSTGTEAVEGALKAAFRARGHGPIIAFHGAYHGETQGALQCMGNEAYRETFLWTQAPVQFFQFNDEAIFSRLPPKISALLIEPVQGEGGIRPARRKWLRRLVREVRKREGLVIFDEIQTGFGRTGAWWAFLHYGVIPDILVMGKALGGGFPLGGFALRKGLLKPLLETGLVPHLTTFGGHPVACATSIAFIRVMKKEKLILRVQKLARKVKTFLHQLHRTFPQHIADVRGMGLMWGIECRTQHIAQEVLKYALEHEVWTDTCLLNPQVIRIAPPYIIRWSELKRGLRTIYEGFSRL